MQEQTRSHWSFLTEVTQQGPNEGVTNGYRVYSTRVYDSTFRAKGGQIGDQRKDSGGGEGGHL